MNMWCIIDRWGNVDKNTNNYIFPILELGLFEKEDIMPAVTAKKEKTSNVTIVKKMRDYSNEPAIKKKAEDAVKFLKKHGLPESFKKKK